MSRLAGVRLFRRRGEPSWLAGPAPAPAGELAADPYVDNDPAALVGFNNGDPIETFEEQAHSITWSQSAAGGGATYRDGSLPESLAGLPHFHFDLGRFFQKPYFGGGGGDPVDPPGDLTLTHTAIGVVRKESVNSRGLYGLRHHSTAAMAFGYGLNADADARLRYNLADGLLSGGGVPNDEWHVLAWRKFSDGGANVHFYIDAALDSIQTSASDNSLSMGSHDVAFGRNAVMGGNVFVGRIQRWLFYNRLLTHDETVDSMLALKTLYGL